MVDADIAPPDLEASERATGVVLTMPEPSGNNMAAHIRVDALDAGDGWAKVEPFTAIVTLADGADLAMGDEVTIAWSAETMESLPPGYSGYLAARGVTATARASKVDVEEQGPRLFQFVQDVRDDLAEGFDHLMPGDAGALATGIVTGDDSGLSEEASEAFLRTGTSHITAVSGSNVAMVLAVWNLVIPAGRRRRLLAIQITIVVSIWLYALLTGLEPPATRAATMASLMLFGSRFGRRPDPMTLLALTSAAMVLWNPRNVEMISFWLSIVATAAIISRVPTESGSGGSRVARGMFEGTMLAQIATLPFVLITFGTWSLVSVVANVLLAPLLWAAFPLCFLLGVIILVAPMLAPMVSWAPYIILTMCLEIVQGLGDVMPQVSIAHSGLAGALAIGVPCLIAVLILGKDGQRWLQAGMANGRSGSARLLIFGAGPAAGMAAAGLMVMLLR
jgi:competence protein ComEC